MSVPHLSIIVHGSAESHFANTVRSIYAPANHEVELIVLNPDGADLSDLLAGLNDRRIVSQVLVAPAESQGSLLNAGFQAASAPYLLYLNNEGQEIELKRGALEIFLLQMQHYPQTGMIYADYERIANGDSEEVKLLKHHAGRVRDNQDLGSVFCYSRSALESADYADAGLKCNTLYDLHLKVGEQHELLHVANRYSGSLYSTKSEAKGHNVFDYLMASKESQLEAEEVLSGHLKRTGAYLEPGKFYAERPKTVGAALKASVIIPVHDRPQFIGKAIESVQAQTVSEVEVVVVVNGGSDDPTVAEVKRYQEGGDKHDPEKPQVQLLIYAINSLGLCLNMGARAARGEYYVQLDSDDRLKSNAVEEILKVYESDPKIGMVIGSYEVWELAEDGSYSRLEELPVVTHDEWMEENGRNNLLRINGAGAPRSIPIALIKEIGFSMNEEPYARNYGEDYHMVLQISERHRIGRVWDAIYEVVRHSGGTDHNIDQATIDRNDEAKDYMRLEAIKRRKKLNEEGEQR